MRDLVKGNIEMPHAERAAKEAPMHSRWRHHLGRRLFAITCLLLTGLFALQLLHVGSTSSSLASDLSPGWDNPTGFFSRLKWRGSGLRWRVQRSLEDTFPAGEWGLILKMSFCAVAAAVFLRGPQRI